MSEKTVNQDAVEVLSVETNPAVRAGGGAALWIALLLLAALAAGGGWYLWNQAQALRGELQTLATHKPPPVVAAPQREDPRVTQALQASSRAEQHLDAVESQIAALGEQQIAAQGAIERIAATDRSDWALAEVEYLLRLANQSLLMGREVRGAIALIDAADEILKAQDDPALHAVRAALAADRLELRAVADFDIEGLYLRLAALGERLPALVIAEHVLETGTAASAAGPEAASGPAWLARVRAVLDKYIVVRHQSEPVKPLLPLAEEQYLRVNLRLALEQAKLAVLAAEPEIYHGALQQAAALIATYFSPQVLANRAFLGELEQLAQLEIAPALPDISDSLRVLRERPQAPLVPDGG